MTPDLSRSTHPTLSGLDAAQVRIVAVTSQGRATTGAAELLALVDAAIESGEAQLGWGRLERLWRDHPGPATATQVLQRASRLGPRPTQRTCRVTLLRSCTVEPLVPVLRAAGAVNRIDLVVDVGAYDNIAQQILDPRSQLYAGDRPDVVIAFAPTRDLSPPLWNGSGVADDVDQLVADMERLVTAFRANSGATLLLHGLDLPPRPALGIIGRSQFELIAAANRRLGELTAAHRGVFVIDYDAIVASAGRSRWYDERKWATMRMPFRSEHLGLMANEWMRWIVPALGRGAKALICDLDNTLWGGVVGEDGTDGIEIGESSKGAGYVRLQRSVLDLMSRGVLLGICSKNNPADVDDVFASRPEMVLQAEDFVARRIGWDDKVTGLAAIAAELNIGLDALAFLDDSPVECDLVRTLLPEVTVIELDHPPDSTFQPVEGHPMFERLTLTSDDRRRTDMYRQQAERRQVESRAGSLEEYLTSLDVQVEMRPVGAADIARAAQLTQKTNQFNVTTRRYSEQQIEAMVHDPSWRAFVASATDRFGDHGTIGLALVRTTPGEWEIDTLLMSCRVIGRGVESAMLVALVDAARRAGAESIAGEFAPTPKNAPARQIFGDHGFTAEGGSADVTRWRRPTVPLGAPDWVTLRDRTEEES